MIKHKITLQNKEFICIINRTKNKGITLQINLPNEIIVKANNDLSNDFIFSSIKQHEARIVQKVKKVYHQIAFLEFDKCLKDKKIWLFGILYEITFHRDISDIEIDFIHKNILIGEHLQKNKQYLKVIRMQAVEKIKTLFDEIISRFKEIDYKVTLQFKDYRSRWGVCYFRDRKIILNERIIHLPIELIEAIISHEIVHLFVPNHGKEFYHRLLEMVPNYRQLKKEINRFQPILDKRY